MSFKWTASECFSKQNPLELETNSAKCHSSKTWTRPEWGYPARSLGSTLNQIPSPLCAWNRAHCRIQIDSTCPRCSCMHSASACSTILIWWSRLELTVAHSRGFAAIKPVNERNSPSEQVRWKADCASDAGLQTTQSTWRWHHKCLLESLYIYKEHNWALNSH